MRYTLPRVSFCSIIKPNHGGATLYRKFGKRFPKQYSTNKDLSPLPRPIVGHTPAKLPVGHTVLGLCIRFSATFAIYASSLGILSYYRKKINSFSKVFWGFQKCLQFINICRVTFATRQTFFRQTRSYRRDRLRFEESSRTRISYWSRHLPHA